MELIWGVRQCRRHATD